MTYPATKFIAFIACLIGCLVAVKFDVLPLAGLLAIAVVVLSVKLVPPRR